MNTRSFNCMACNGRIIVSTVEIEKKRMLRTVYVDGAPLVLASEPWYECRCPACARTTHVPLAALADIDAGPLVRAQPTEVWL